MGNKFSTNTLKTKSAAATQRIKLRIGKKTNAINMAKREIAKLLEADKVQSAKIKAEGVIREENYVKTLEWLSLMCELMKTRIHLIASSTAPPDDMMETYCTILYCSKRTDVPELMEIAGQLQAKYGEKFIERNANNRSGRVDNRIIQCLSAQPPTHDIIVAKLQEVSLKFNKRKWEDPGEDDHKSSGMKVVSHAAAEVDQTMVDRCVGFLQDPAMADYSREQKAHFLREKGANDTEIAVAIQTVKHIEQLRPAQPAPAYPNPTMPAGPPGGSYPAPPHGGGFGGGQPAYVPPPAAPAAPAYPAAPSGPGFGGPPGFDAGPNMPGASMMNPGQPGSGGFGLPSSGPSSGEGEGVMDLPSPPAAQETNDMDDLEARFAALKKGL